VEEELNNKEFLSQFERAAKELGIKVIHANSPQAKGRVERSFKPRCKPALQQGSVRGLRFSFSVFGFFSSFVFRFS
ncbi:MAG: hypothetical protein PHU64_07770, partial [Candidatus Omnitrophica bacterium]|nr:hypothetical protein [Candidatus Omnitrophota bacterium]